MTDSKGNDTTNFNQQPRLYLPNTRLPPVITQSQGNDRSVRG